MLEAARFLLAGLKELHVEIDADFVEAGVVLPASVGPTQIEKPTRPEARNPHSRSPRGPFWARPVVIGS